MSALIILLRARPLGLLSPHPPQPRTPIWILADASVRFTRTLISGWMLLAWILTMAKEAMRGIAWLTGATAEPSA